MRDSVAENQIRILETVEEPNGSDEFNEFFSEDVHSSKFSSFRQFLWNKLWTIKLHNYRTRNIRQFAKFLRHKFHLTKEPKHKGYGRYFTEKERRY